MKDCVYIGYMRMKNRGGEKFYFPQFNISGKRRRARKIFRKASLANDHGKRLAARFVSFCEAAESENINE